VKAPLSLIRFVLVHSTVALERCHDQNVTG